jgi:hypothetical protein
MKKGLLLSLVIACACVGYGQFSPKEQVVYTRFTSPSWLEVLKNTEGKTASFTQKMLQYAKDNPPLTVMANHGYTKEDSLNYFQNSQLWISYNPYLPPFVPYSYKTTREDPEEDLALYLTSLNLWKGYNKEKWGAIEQALKAEKNGDYPELKISNNKLQSYKRYEEQLMQWQKQNPWYAKVLMKAHLEQVKRQLGL